MIRLLIVDNERPIVDSLIDLFAREGKPELETYAAYSAAQALEWLGRTKIDIVLSDIRMPGMDGLELQREIVKQWPSCKVVFLTGYDDFEYIQQGMRNGGVDYLLKTEGPDAILRAVDKAAEELYEAVEAERLILLAENQMRRAMPLLLNEYMLEMICGDPGTMRRRGERFAEWQVPLEADGDVMLVIGRVDDWRDELGAADKQLMLFAIRNIAEEFLTKSARCVSVIWEKSKLMWFIQPLERLTSGESKGRLNRFVHGTIESIQIACKQHLKLGVSFASAVGPAPWTRAPETFHDLKRLLGRGLGSGKELILIDRPGSEHSQPDPGLQTREIRSRLEKVGPIAAFLENGQKESFFAEFSLLMGLSAGRMDREDPLKLEVYYSLVALFLAYLNRWGLHDEIGASLDLGKLSRFESHASWEEAEEYFISLAECLFEQKNVDRHNREDDLIKHIRLYVERNLAGDLSLTRIGEVVGYNPYYLTRLYKQITNEGLTEFIAEARLARAKKLLENNRMIVQDISRAVGFMTEQSFYRFFKKATNLTPQEYRERHADLQNG